MRRLDLHVHSQASPDARGSLMDLAQAAQAAGLHGFAITDHDRCADEAELQAAMDATGMLIVPGCESSTIEGHVLCYGVWDAPAKGSDVDEVADMVADQGGVCVAAHPLKLLSGIGPQQLQEHHAAGRIVAAEGINGRERHLVQHNSMRLLRQFGIPSVGGTDAHWVRDMGTAWTWFDDTVMDAAAAVAALRRGAVQADGGHLPRRSVWSHGASLPFRAAKRSLQRK